MNKVLFFIFLFCANFLMAQNTVGLLSYVPSQSYEGYNLIYPHNQPNVYLLNNCGEIVHTWEDESNFRPGNTVYLMDDGSIIKTKRDATITDDAIWAGGGGEIIEGRTWDNELLWSYTSNDSLGRLHHDISVLPDGNVLMIAWELKTGEEAIAAGRDTAKLAQNKLWPDSILELDPESGDIVWEWHVWDHLIQDYDETKANYGVVGDHPELVDINYDTSDGHPDWMHANALDYNPILDQIMICVPTFHEFWVIDHTTSSTQAAGHTGGFYGRGGDLLYRWGNPASYRKGTEEDQKLFYPHDAHWVDDYVDDTYPDYNNIAVFNNRVSVDISTANVLIPPFDMYENVYIKDAGVFWPEDFKTTIQHPEPNRMWSTGLSSIQRLPNGNSLICVGRFGYSFEITPDNEIVWEYITPRNRTAAATQGDTLTINQNLTFRLQRLPLDHPGFEGRDLEPQGWLELEPVEDYCERLVSVMDVIHKDNFVLFPNPSSGMLTIEWTGTMSASLTVYNSMGVVIKNYPKCSGGRKYLNTSDWQNGIYFVSLDGLLVKRVVVE